MADERVVGDYDWLCTSAVEAPSEIIIFLTPSDVFFIESVDTEKIFFVEGSVAGDQGWLVLDAEVKAA